jgi:lysyl-tRNA synthetase class 2
MGTAGRIVAIREASKNLVFLDVQSDGATVQVLSEAKNFHGSLGEDGDKDAVKLEFRKVHESLRRGDIIGAWCGGCWASRRRVVVAHICLLRLCVRHAGVKGFPGKSGKGELSVIPRQIEILAPCIQPFPNSKYGIREPVRHARHSLSLIGVPLTSWTNCRRSASARSIWTC